MLATAKEEGRPIISPAEPATAADEDPEGNANDPALSDDPTPVSSGSLPLDGSALNQTAVTQRTGAGFWFGVAALVGVGWLMFGKGKKATKKSRSRRR